MRRIIKGVLLAALGIAALGALALYSIPAVQDQVISRTIERAFATNHDNLMAKDALRVAVCGSGSPFADPDRRPACNLVFAAGKIFVVDAGSGSFARVSRWRMPLQHLEAVFLTHFHSDHIADVPEANLQSWVAQRPLPLTVYGGPGIERLVAGFTEAFALDSMHRIDHHGAEFLYPERGRMQAQPIANSDGSALTGTQSAVIYDRDGLVITAFAVDHPPVIPAYGYRFDYGGRSVVFSGDTHKSPGLIQHAKGADILLHEAMDKQIVEKMRDAAARAGRLPAQKITGDILSYHASPRDAAETAQEAGVAVLVLTHLIPPVPGWLSHKIFLRGTEDTQIETRIAYDGMLIELPLNSKEVRFSDLRR